MCTHAFIPDDILELMLVRLDSTACLIRASSTCKRWRRLVAGVGFLRRFRSIHGPPIAGTYHRSLRFTPSPSSGIDSRHFSLDFLPFTSNNNSVTWIFKETRAGLVLLERNDRRPTGFYQQDFIICEPLSRRYVVIPPLYRRANGYYYTEAFLLNGHSSDSSSIAMADGSGGGIGLSNFRVICKAYNRCGGNEGVYEAGVFTSGSSCWRPIRINGRSSFRCFDLMGHSNGKIYWWVDGGIVLLVDRVTADLAFFVLQEGVEGFDDRYRAAVTTGHDGKARIVVGRRYGGDVKVFAARHVLAAGGGEWVLEKNIRLPMVVATFSHQWQKSCWYFRDPAPAASYQKKGTVYIQSEGLLLALDLDTETMEPEPAVKLGCPFELPWPPALRACRQPGTDLGQHGR